MSENRVTRESDPSIEACVRLLRECWHGWGEDAHDALSRWVDWAECGYGDEPTPASRDDVAMLLAEMLPTLDGDAGDMVRVWAAMLGEVRRAA